MLREGWERVKTAALALWQTLKDFWRENGPAIREFGAELATLAATVGIDALVIALNGMRRSLVAISEIIKFLTPITRDWWAGQKKQADELNAVLLKVMAWWDGLGTSNQTLAERMKATWKEWGAEIQSDWSGALAYMRNNMSQWGAEIQSDWESIKGAWGTATGALGGVWDGLVARLKGAWQGFMDWLLPWLTRVENFFGTIANAPANAANAVKGFASKALGWLPSSLQPPGLTPAMAGGTPPFNPATVTNTNQAQNVNQQTDVNATINVQAPSPELAAEMTARKVNDLARTNVRHGQSFDF
jgi:hypothetical protein